MHYLSDIWHKNSVTHFWPLVAFVKWEGTTGLVSAATSQLCRTGCVLCLPCKGPLCLLWLPCLFGLSLYNWVLRFPPEFCRPAQSSDYSWAAADGLGCGGRGGGLRRSGVRRGFEWMPLHSHEAHWLLTLCLRLCQIPECLTADQTQACLIHSSQWEMTKFNLSDAGCHCSLSHPYKKLSVALQSLLHWGVNRLNSIKLFKLVKALEDRKLLSNWIIENFCVCSWSRDRTLVTCM